MKLVVISKFSLKLPSESLIHTGINRYNVSAHSCYDLIDMGLGEDSLFQTHPVDTLALKGSDVKLSCTLQNVWCNVKSSLPHVLET